MSEQSTEEVLVPVHFIVNVRNALRSATTIGERSCRDGDHLNYSNHDRLIREADDLLTYPAQPTPPAADEGAGGGL